MKLGILDYGAGNMHNICRLLSRLNHSYVLQHTYTDHSFDGLILPGVGSYNFAMSSLKSSGLSELIFNHVRSGRPLLSVCVGMQVLSNHGDEGGYIEGLSLIPGSVERLPHDEMIRLPHIGWSPVIFSDSSQQHNAYFAHSFFFKAKFSSNIVANSFFGNFSFPAVIRHENILGIQFHPEISSSFGSNLVSSFLK